MNPLTACERAPEFARPASRYEVIDAARGIAACIIVAHHLTLYAPKTTLVDELASGITVPLFRYGAYAVQLFLVIGGFALAMSVSASALSGRQAIKLVAARYLRLVIPYLVMLAGLMIVWTTIGNKMSQSLVGSPSVGQMVAHLFFLQDVLGYDNLSAGTWYLCIDIQYSLGFIVLYATLSMIVSRLQIAVGVPKLAAGCLIPLGLASAWYWNRNSSNENYVIYFLGSLVLGSLVAWTIKGHLVAFRSAKVRLALRTFAGRESSMSRVRPRLTKGQLGLRFAKRSTNLGVLHL